MDDLVVVARVPTISGGSLGDGAKAWHPEFRVHSGLEFVNISKRCSHFARFCTGQTIGKESPIQTTAVIEDLIKLRDKTWGNLRAGIDEQGDDEPKSLFQDGPARKKPKKMTPIEGTTVVTATVPPIMCDSFNAPAMKMKLLCEKPRGSLWVELSEANLKYMRVAILAALAAPADGTARRCKDDVVRSSEPGVRWEYRRSSWYCRFEDKTGNMRYKEFKVDGQPNSDQFEVNKSAAEVQAIQFVHENAS